MILTLHHRTTRTGEAVSSHFEVFPQEDFPASNAASASANVSSRPLVGAFTNAPTVADTAMLWPWPIDITFTKWITGFPQMAGFVGGDVVGGFTGEVLDAKTTADLLITRLEAVYEVQAGQHSFAALIQGGQKQPDRPSRTGRRRSGWEADRRPNPC